ncbi:MAG: PilZ domain-containing protein [Pseudomonadota bacterium]
MSLPLLKSVETSVSELRADPRTHLFVVATLSSEDTLSAVRIRNLSASGALIEGAALPAEGSVVRIRRGDLSVEAVLAWQSNNQAGLAFKSNIFVPAWLPKTASKQSAIDQVMFEAKNRPEGLSEPSQANCLRPDSRAMLFELTALRSELATLGEALAGDIILVATHPEIQALDIAIQRIDRLLSLTETGDSSEKAADKIIH